jgi:hypothetical protein
MTPATTRIVHAGAVKRSREMTNCLLQEVATRSSGGGVYLALCVVQGLASVVDAEEQLVGCMPPSEVVASSEARHVAILVLLVALHTLLQCRLQVRARQHPAQQVKRRGVACQAMPHAECAESTQEHEPFQRQEGARTSTPKLLMLLARGELHTELAKMSDLAGGEHAVEPMPSPLLP